jgi:hypothetical protein
MGCLQAVYIVKVESRSFVIDLLETPFIKGSMAISPPVKATLMSDLTSYWRNRLLCHTDYPGADPLTCKE